MIEAEITKSVIQKGNKKEESFEEIFYLFVLVPNSHSGYTVSYPVTCKIAILLSKVSFIIYLNFLSPILILCSSFEFSVSKVQVLIVPKTMTAF